MSYAYRAAEVADLCEMLVFEQQYFDDTPTFYNDLLTHLLNEDLSFVCVRGSRIVGLVKVEADADTCAATITVLCVSQAHRRRGIGRTLLAHAVGAAWQLERVRISEISLHTAPHNAAAIELYKRAGFTVQEQVPRFFSDESPALRMVCKRGTDSPSIGA
ncbi:hypothetical protein PAPHI01_1268 [Pancytospora philotis]|nr:hypothetical protein PAPHI01_1268 [Pancytospora philotis]